MKHFKLLIGFVLISFAGWTQSLWNESVEIRDSTKVGILLIGEGASNSNALTNAFFFGFVNGRFVTAAEKDEMKNRFKSTNRFGQDATYGLKIGFRGNNKIFSSFNIGFAERYHIDGTLTNEAMELILYGNKQFAGNEINVSDSRLRFSRWKELSFGGNIPLDNGFNLMSSVAFVLGGQNLNFSTDYASLYTSEIGDQMRLNGTFNLNQTDTSNSNPHAVNGYGFGLNIALKKELKAKNALSGYIQIAVQDIGAIYWNKQSVKYKGDTLYVYQGTEIDRILDLRNDNINTLTPDSIWGLITPETTRGSYHTLLPSTVQLSLFQDFKNYDALLGANYRLFSSYSPFIYTRVRYKLKDFRLGANAGFGGYGTVQLGVEASYLQSGWHFTVGTRNLEGLALWKYTGGTSAFIQLAKFF